MRAEKSKKQTPKICHFPLFVISWILQTLASSTRAAFARRNWKTDLIHRSVSAIERTSAESAAGCGVCVRRSTSRRRCKHLPPRRNRHRANVLIWTSARYAYITIAIRQLGVIRHDARSVRAFDEKINTFIYFFFISPNVVSRITISQFISRIVQPNCSRVIAESILWCTH